MARFGASSIRGGMMPLYNLDTLILSAAARFSQVQKSYLTLGSL